jgi:hypothetical protein
MKNYFPQTKITPRYLFLLTVLLVATAGLMAEVGPDWIEQWGIRWTFDKNLSTDGAGDTYQYGTYVNGDYWIRGPVNVISFNPPCQTVGGRTINGSMLNPLLIVQHGYDNSIDGFDPNLCVNLDVSAANPLSINPSTVPIQSLVSTISTATVPDGSRPRLQTAAVLTVVAAVPGTDAFRPPYVANAKPAEIRASAIDLNKIPLAELTPTASAITLAEAERRVERVWLSHNTTWWHSFMHPVDNMGWYGREIAKSINEAALVMNLNTTPDKTTLVNRIVQVGIDLYGIALERPEQWDNDGGGMCGRILPFAIAAHLLDHAGMKEICTRVGQFRYTEVDGDGHQYWPDRETPGYVHFGELDQTHYVSQKDVDMTNNTTDQSNDPFFGTTSHSTPWRPDDRSQPHVPYTQADLGLPEYGIRHATFPCTNNNHWGASSYRGVNSHFPGAALVAHIMDIKSLFNHPAYFDYCDRVMYMNRPGGEYESWRSGTNSPGSFVVDMWETYRVDYGCIYTGLNTQTHQRQYENCSLGIPTVPGHLGQKNTNNDWAVYPNPMRDHLFIPVETGPGMSLPIAIFDPAGNLIAEIQVDHRSPVTWDATDHSGRPVEPGVYYVKYGTRVMKIMIID